jgi:hypothetical protein
LEHSRHLLEQDGVRLAAISYDSLETLAEFAEKHGIGFPLLSDSGSAVIRAFGIFNTNMAPDLRAYGVPHPVEYLLTSEGEVARKYFVPNYQHRVTGSAVALREFGTADAVAGLVNLKSGAVTAQIGLASGYAFAGQELGFFAKFRLEPGWHVYGSPLPDGYTATSVVFDDPKVIRQSFQLPPATPIEIASLQEVLPVYSASFEGVGSLLLKFPLAQGPTTLSGQLRFQQCSDRSCEPSETLRFELPLNIEKFLTAGLPG